MKYEFPGVLKKVLKRVTPASIMSGFEKTGIFPKTGPEGPITLRKILAEVATIQEQLNESLMSVGENEGKKTSHFIKVFEDHTTQYITLADLQDFRKVSEKNFDHISEISEKN
jgi:hypothetical protein